MPHEAQTKAGNTKVIKNKVRLEGDTIYIYLNRGKVTLIDKEDYPIINQYSWYASRRRNGFSACASSASLSMHRLLMQPPKDKVVDHINHDPLDNRRKNLRVCSPQENCRNRRVFNGISRFKGVTWDKRKEKWYARITLYYKKIRLGYFHDELEAAKAYDRGAIKYHKEFACLNFPQST